MGYRLNPGNGLFEGHVRSRYYVDKSAVIAYLNSCISGGGEKCFCVSRPSRFGKSCVADMLVAYYGRGCDSSALFGDLKIADDPSYKAHLNAHDVIFFTMTDVVYAGGTVEKGIEWLKGSLAGELKDYLECDFSENELIPMLEEYHEKTHRGFVFIIDEWDSPFREKSYDREGQELYIRFLKDLLEERDYVLFAYMTGIFPAGGCPGGDALGFFCQSSMTDPGPLKDCVGFTEEDVARLCEGAKFTHETIRKWYGGYNLNGARLYNSNSVHWALSEGRLEGYWGKTGMFVVLSETIEKNVGGLYDVIFSLMAKEKLAFPSFRTEKHNLIKPKKMGDFLGVLLHGGFVSYNMDDGTTEIPNHEVRWVFEIDLRDMEPYPLAEIYKYSENLLEATVDVNAAKAADMLGYISDKLKHVRGFSKGPAFVRAAYMAAYDSYESVINVPVGETGSADLVLYPDSLNAHPGISYLPCIVIELKNVDEREVSPDGTKVYDCIEQSGYRGDVIHVTLWSKKMTKAKRRALVRSGASAGEEDKTHSVGNDAAPYRMSRIVLFCEITRYRV